jgi:hypothetical protein
LGVDVSKPAFSTFALATLTFQQGDEGVLRSTVRSDYRCQLRFRDEAEAHECRVYFLSQAIAERGESVAGVIAFLDWQMARERCRVGREFGLYEGDTPTAYGAIEAVGQR